MLPDIHRATQKFYIFLIVYLTGCTPSIDGTNALDRLGFNAFTVDKTSLGDVAMKLFFKKAE